MALPGVPITQSYYFHQSSRVTRLPLYHRFGVYVFVTEQTQVSIYLDEKWRYTATNATFIHFALHFERVPLLEKRRSQCLNAGAFTLLTTIYLIMMLLKRSKAV